MAGKGPRVNGCIVGIDRDHGVPHPADAVIAGRGAARIRGRSAKHETASCRNRDPPQSFRDSSNAWARCRQGGGDHSVLGAFRAFCPGTKSQSERCQSCFGLGRRIAKRIETACQGRIRARAVGPQGQPFARQPLPVETRAGVDLAAGGHVRMADHGGWTKTPARHDPAQKQNQRIHLRGGKGAVAGIGCGTVSLR